MLTIDQVDPIFYFPNRHLFISVFTFDWSKSSFFWGEQLVKPASVNY